MTAPVETSKFVLTTHYDVSITSQLAKNILSTAIFCYNTLKYYFFSYNWYKFCVNFLPFE